jgi:DNA polymerase III subunit delta'
MFESIPGQARIKEQFVRALRDDAVAHAYLFSGPEGLAKTAFARELAVALVTSCVGCGTCSECDRARRGLHPDLHVLEREGDVIRVAQVEPILADLSLKPFAAGRRVWVIPEVEYLHPAAANKLLKTIEEPPRHVHFLLVTDRLEAVLPTIVSRCRLVEFRPLSDAEVEVHLRDAHGLGEVHATALARLASGSIERAERLALDALGPGRRAEYLAQAGRLVGGSRSTAAEAQEAFLGVLERHRAEIKAASQAELAGRLKELELQFPDKRELKWRQDALSERQRREERRLARLASLDALDVLVSWVRDLWVVACGAGDVLCNCDRESELRGAAVATPELYGRLLAVASQTRKDLNLNVDQKLALQALFARFEEVAESA